MKEYTLHRDYQPEITKGEIELSTCEKITTIELPWNENKVGESCIPEGEYVVKRDKHGKHTWFKVMDVKERSFIEIHEGYKPQHSQGCILLDVVELQDLLLDTKGEDFVLKIVS